MCIALLCIHNTFYLGTGLPDMLFDIASTEKEYMGELLYAFGV